MAAVVEACQSCPRSQRNSKAVVGNYRPISLLEPLNKVFERLVARALITHALAVGAIPGAQAAFLRYRGSADVLTFFVQHAIGAMNARRPFRAILTDVSGAFDRVDRSILLRRLEEIGVTGPLLKLLSSYLSNRYFHVVAAGAVSWTFVEPAGVVQGSALGPILWLIFFAPVFRAINERHPDVMVPTFADDLKLAGPPESVLAACSTFQEWCAANRVTADPAKEAVLNIRNAKDGSTRPANDPATDKPVPLHHVRDLGLEVDENLVFSAHFDKQLARGHKAVTRLLRLSGLMPEARLAALFKSNVYGVLEYGMMGYIFATPAQLARLDGPGSRFTRCTGVALPPMGHRRFVGAMCYMYRVIVLSRCAPCVLSCYTRATAAPARKSLRFSPAVTHGYQIECKYTAGRVPDLDVYRRVLAIREIWNALPVDCFGHGAKAFKAAINKIEKSI